MSTRPALVLTGATGTGKSRLAVEVAERIGGEIISADSRQLYREMDVGTAKPPAEARRRIPHHGIDCLDPDQHYSAGGFARDAWAYIREIRGRGKQPMVVGGTGFFIRALLSPLGPEPQVDPERRRRLREYLARLAPAELKRWLGRLDPDRARQLVREEGRQRLGRSLEVVLLSGRRHSWWLARAPETGALTATVVCLDLPREELYRRIDQRFQRMMEYGLLEEVRQLMDRYPAGSPGLTSVGYAELIEHLRGNMSLEQAVELAKRNTRHYARRQLTWFRHQLPEGTVRLDGSRTVGELADAVVRVWEGGEP